MSNKKFEDEMENLKTPEVQNINHQNILKITLLNAKKSSRIGIVFIIIPSLFILGLIIKYWLEIDLDVFTAIENEMSKLDKINSLKWIAPLLLVGLPFISIVINLLAITHFYWDKNRKELLITIKYRRLNFILLFISMIIVGIFFLYVVIENFTPHH